MRITGGQIGGLMLKAPKGDRVRPTQNRVREAVFAMLAAKVVGARVLDLFAGTGAMGVEAGSRGAASVTWVEEDKRNVEVLKANVGLLKGECETVVVCDEAVRFLKRQSSTSDVQSPSSNFDFVFADPPYAWVEKTGWTKVLTPLENILAEDGLFIAEQSAELAPNFPENWEILKDKTYGGTRICVCRKSKGETK